MSTQLYQNGQTSLVVHSTTDYGKFSFDPRNRPINQDHLERLYDSISRKNMLREHPIVVSSSGVVLDGQHRLKVAEAMGVNIYYIVSDRIDMGDVPILNSVNRRWQSEDYLSAYCQEGRRDYIALNDFWRANRDILSLNHAMNLCHYGDRAGMNELFRRGAYRCNDVPFAQKVVNALRDFAPYFKHYKDSAFVHTVSNLMGNVDYNHDRMMMKMKYLSSRLVKCPDVMAYIDVINEIYNYRATDSNRVVLRKLTSSDKKWRPDRKNSVA